jgi:tetratricopeptide (TPR) repeat protein
MALPLLFFFAAAAANANQTPPPAPPNGQYMARSADPSVNRAGQLLNLSRPSQALELLEPALQRHPRDPGVLMLAGLAAYRSDHLPEALQYWSQSLDLAPNPTLDAIFQDARREAAADRSNDKIYSQHIALRYEGDSIPAASAQIILAELEGDYSRISAELGCTFSERVAAIAQSREQYMRATSAAEWSGGHFDGRIHLAWSAESGARPAIERALAHEMVHACLMTLPSGPTPWPVWLQEGLAQELSGDTIQPSTLEQLRQLASRHAIPRLEDLGQDWFTMRRQDALDVYHLSLAAAQALCNIHARHGIRQILSHPESLLSITTELDAKLGF